MGVASKAERRFSWTDYRSWGDGERWELIGGQPFCMSPAPSSRHQMIVTRLCGHLFQHFEGRSCVPLVSPIDVKLSADDVVQPDVVVVYDRSQITETHVEGAPTLAIEVLSPSSHRHYRVRKLRLPMATDVASSPRAKNRPSGSLTVLPEVQAKSSQWATLS